MTLWMPSLSMSLMVKYWMPRFFKMRLQHRTDICSRRFCDRTLAEVDQEMRELTALRGRRPAVPRTPGPSRRGRASSTRTREYWASGRTGERRSSYRKGWPSAARLPPRPRPTLALSCSSLSMNATGCPWRFPDGEHIGVLMSAWASTQMRHRSGHWRAWPLTEPMARL